MKLGTWSVSIGLLIWGTVFCGLVIAQEVKQYTLAFLAHAPTEMYLMVFEEIQKTLAERTDFPGKIQFPRKLQVVFELKDASEESGLLVQKARELVKRSDIDLIIVAGTAANRAVLRAQDDHLMANPDQKVINLFGICISDPIGSKFILSLNDSGRDNYTLRVDQNYFRRMFEVFHDEIVFRKLGLLYSDQEAKNEQSSIDDAYDTAKQRGYQIVERLIEKDDVKHCLSGLQVLISEGIDAFFIPKLNCFDNWESENVNQLLTLLHTHKIPTFARQGPIQVKAGALMGFSVDFKIVSRFIASHIIRILEGELPRSLPMVDNVLSSIVVNLAVARKIEFQPSVELIGASNEVYEEIILPEGRLVK